MLGRLRMTIPQCIEAYTEMSGEIFDANIIVQAAHLLSAHRFSGNRLRDAVDEVVRRYKGESSTMMLDEGKARQSGGAGKVCRTYAPIKYHIMFDADSSGVFLRFVVAVPGCNVHRPPKLFRSYDNRAQDKSADRCQIWEAARATSCAPSFFPEICVDKVYYSDGGLGYNNPAQLVLDEARSLWGSQHPIGRSPGYLTRLSLC